jgi:hypothetical protein
VKPTTLEISSISGAITSMAAAITLERTGVIVGIVTALLTLALNIEYTRRKDRREQRESDARIAALEKP